MVHLWPSTGPWLPKRQATPKQGWAVVAGLVNDGPNKNKYLRPPVASFTVQRQNECRQVFVVTSWNRICRVEWGLYDTSICLSLQSPALTSDNGRALAFHALQIVLAPQNRVIDATSQQHESSRQSAINGFPSHANFMFSKTCMHACGEMVATMVGACCAVESVLGSAEANL